MNGKVATHQVKGAGSETCSSSGVDVKEALGE